MEKVKITVLKRFSPHEEPFVNLLKQANMTYNYEIDPSFGACEVFKDGQEFVIEGLRTPEGFCGAAWHTLYMNLRALAVGGNLPWFNEKGVAIQCCHDILRPVVFKLERI